MPIIITESNTNTATVISNSMPIIITESNTNSNYNSNSIG